METSYQTERPPSLHDFSRRSPMSRFQLGRRHITGLRPTVSIYSSLLAAKSVPPDVALKCGRHLAQIWLDSVVSGTHRILVICFAEYCHPQGVDQEWEMKNICSNINACRMKHFEAGENCADEIQRDSSWRSKAASCAPKAGR